MMTRHLCLYTCRIRNSGIAEEESGRKGLTKRVDHTLLLLSDTIHATDPLASIPTHTDTLDPMRALERGDKVIPQGVELAMRGESTTTRRYGSKVSFKQDKAQGQ